MTDLEMTRLCAEAMGIYSSTDRGEVIVCETDDPQDSFVYAPLTSDALAMALVKRFKLHVCPSDEGIYSVWHHGTPLGRNHDHDDADLNRAIVSCVAHMQAGGG